MRRDYSKGRPPYNLWTVDPLSDFVNGHVHVDARVAAPAIALAMTDMEIITRPTPRVPRQTRSRR